MILFGFIHKKERKIFIKGDKTVLEINDDTEFILLNANDYDYVKIYFCKKDLDFIYNNLNKIPDRFTKRIIWCNLWQMVRDNAANKVHFAFFPNN